MKRATSARHRGLQGVQQHSLSGRVDPHQDSDPTGRSRAGTPSRCHTFGPTHWPTTTWVAVASGPSHTRSISPEYFAAVTLSTWSSGMPSVTVLIGCARRTLVDGTAAWAPPPARVVPLVARWSPRPIATTRARGIMVRLWLSGRLPAPLAVVTTRTQSFGRRAPETAVSGRTATVSASLSCTGGSSCAAVYKPLRRFDLHWLQKTANSGIPTYAQW